MELLVYLTTHNLFKSNPETKTDYIFELMIIFFKPIISSGGCEERYEPLASRGAPAGKVRSVPG